MQFWRVSFERGLIPGAYWATATMRGLNKEDSNKIYSDVHMLSHLIGSSNQSLIQRLVEVEAHIKALENKHGWQRQKLEATINQLEAKDDNIDEQQWKMWMSWWNKHHYGKL